MRRSHLYIVSVVFALIFTSHTAIAGGYIGVGRGQSKADIDAVFATSKDETGETWKVYGGIDLNEYFTAEVGFTDLGSFGAAQAFRVGAFDYYGANSFEAESIYVAAVSHIRVGTAVDLFAKVGVHRWSFEAAANYDVYNAGTNTFVRNIGISDDDSGTDPMFGAGLNVELIENFYLRIEWERYQDIGNDTTGESDVDATTAGIVLRFK